MVCMIRHPGHTLAELLVVAAVTAVFLGLAAPGADRWRDAAAARAARDELAAALAATRLTAVARGGASLWVDPATTSFWTTAGDRPDASPERPDGAVDLGERYGVELRLGGTSAVEIHYDPFGLGRVASRTILVRRGGARAGLTVSAYGRVRRW
jgi:type II secretory pathway pseudopilin PulG